MKWEKCKDERIKEIVDSLDIEIDYDKIRFLIVRCQMGHGFSLRQSKNLVSISILMRKHESRDLK